MRTSPLPADFTHARACKPFCEKYLTLPAQETGISKSALGSYENDNDEYKEINHGSLLKLADFYKVSVDYLLGLTNNRKYENTPIEELHLSDEVVERKVNASTTGCCVRLSPMKNSRNCWQTQKSMWTG